MLESVVLTSGHTFEKNSTLNGLIEVNTKCSGSRDFISLWGYENNLNLSPIFKIGIDESNGTVKNINNKNF